MPEQRSISEQLVLAKAYPYDRPKGSYLLESDRVVELKGRMLDGDLKKYTPVLAYGSNASPAQLRRKLPEIKEPIAVMEATVRDLDVVYSARFAGYGAIPATLAFSPGTTLHTHVVFLSEDQLRLVHKTERPAYLYGKLHHPILIDRFGFCDYIYVYFYEHGYTVDGRLVAYEEVHAEKRNFLAIRHDEMLAMVHQCIKPEIDLDSFIAETAGNKVTRAEHDIAIAEHSMRLILERFEQVLPRPKKKIG